MAGDFFGSVRLLSNGALPVEARHKADEGSAGIINKLVSESSDTNLFES